MAVKLSPVFNDAQLDSSGNPYTGAQLFTYAAGSTTKQTAYQDSGGLTQHTNPILLNSRGEPPAPIWLTAGSTYKLYLTTPTDTDPPVTSVRVIDNVSGTNDTTSAVDEWIASGHTPTYISATSFSVTGDQTSTYAKRRRLKSTVTAGTAYSTVLSSVFGAVTTVTVANDVGGNTLDSGLSTVNLGILRGANPAFDADLGTRKGASVTSAATTDIWAVVGDYVHISGSTGPITSFGTAPYAGAERTIIFDSTPTINHNATSLILPGGFTGFSITVAANDRMVVRADTTANMVVTSFIKADGTPVLAPFQTKAISGLTYSNNGSDATNDIDIAAGSVRDSGDTANIVLAATLTKQSDVAWAVGTGLGGLDTGAVGNSDYYIWLIKRPDTGVVDALFSLSSTAPTMPSNYTLKRLIGWFKRVGGTIVAFHAYELEGGGLQMTWDAPTLDVDLAATLTTAVRTDAIKVPLNFTVLALIYAMIVDAGANAGIRIYCPDQADAAPSATVAPGGNIFSITGNPGVWQLEVRTSATGTIAARSTVATIDNYRVVTVGFKWPRRN